MVSVLDREGETRPFLLLQHGITSSLELELELCWGGGETEEGLSVYVVSQHFPVKLFCTLRQKKKKHNRVSRCGETPEAHLVPRVHDID